MALKKAYQCLVCGTALEGPLGLLFHLFGVTRSKHNPNVCNRCDAHIQDGRVIELSVLFADLSGFTEMTNRLGPDRSYEVVDEFFKMASDMLIENNLNFICFMLQVCCNLLIFILQHNCNTIRK